ncbi:MAG: OmpH family outer membrane protein [Aureispira sp.]
MPWILLSILLGTGLLFQTIGTKNELKTAYITNAKLYSEFQLSKELDAKIKEVQLARQAILDSLGLQLRALEQKVISGGASDAEVQGFNQMRNEYGLKQQQFAEDNNMLVQQYQEQISNQLNQYLKDFTKEEGYDYLFGATNDGSLMGAKDAYNITDVVLSYVNARYKGVKK